MIKVFVGKALEYTPFTIRWQIEELERQGIEITNASEADLIISGTFKRVLPFVFRYGNRKKYLIWTAEPRYDTHFTSQPKYLFLPQIHIMNVYTGTYTNNYIWVPDKPLESLQEFSKFEHKKIVALMTYKGADRWQFEHQGVNLDLARLRTEIALAGHQRGLVDIYGRNWPNDIAISESRDKDWRLSKPAILHQYHFNLAFENTLWPYYCTEKIWDAIQEGCLPIYYGKGSTIYDNFPSHSFLDYCDFQNAEALFDYIQNMTPDEYLERMNRCIDAFNQAVEKRQEIRPQHELIDRTVQKIQAIVFGESYKEDSVGEAC
ncbi:MAG: hypothetical protein KME16_11895 [Scytolyngbya sp. HA4215-MV1]|nr:hypothetical protein [Scytolyngbya sp. HA4215-MV1]